MHKILIIQNVSYCPPSYITEEIYRAKMIPSLVFTQNLAHRRYRDNGIMLPTSMNGYDGIFICGGVIDVNDNNKYPFLNQIYHLIRQAHDEKKPVIGSGTGALIIAKAFAIILEKIELREVGFIPITYTEKGNRDPLMSGLPEHHYFCFHQEYPNIPEELLIDNHEIIFSTQETPIAAFRIGEFTWGILPHFEITPDIIRQWIRDMGPTLEDKYPQLALTIKHIDQDLINYIGMHMNIGREIARRFIEFCQENRL